MTFLENQKGLFHNLKTHFRMPVAKRQTIFWSMSGSEKRIDDDWNIDGSRDLSDLETGFTTIYFFGRKSSRWIYVARGGD